MEIILKIIFFLYFYKWTPLHQSSINILCRLPKLCIKEGYVFLLIILFVFALLHIFNLLLWTQAFLTLKWGLCFKCIQANWLYVYELALLCSHRSYWYFVNVYILLLFWCFFVRHFWFANRCKWSFVLFKVLVFYWTVGRLVTHFYCNIPMFSENIKK